MQSSPSACQAKFKSFLVYDQSKLFGTGAAHPVIECHYESCGESRQTLDGNTGLNL